jgi:hypothetical protein
MLPGQAVPLSAAPVIRSQTGGLGDLVKGV